MSKRLLRYLDWPLLGAMLALMAGGVLVRPSPACGGRFWLEPSWRCWRCW